MEAVVFYLLLAQKIYKFKANASEIKSYSLCLENVSKCFTANIIKNKPE